MTIDDDTLPNGEESEDSYFVSMTDIMVGMIFVFIILLMFFVFRIRSTNEPMVPASTYESVVKQRNTAVKQRDAAVKQRDIALDEIAKLRKQIERLRRNPLEKYLQSATTVQGQILQTLKRDIVESGGMKPKDIKVVAEQGILRLTGDVLFPRGMSSITPGSPGDKAIQALALALSKVLPCFSIGPASHPNKQCNPNAVFIDNVFIEGHTDNQPIKGILAGGVSDNLTLSARRATNTEDKIYQYQPALLKMFSIVPSEEGQKLGNGHSPLINASAFGDTRPIVPNDTGAGRKQNRRIDVRILMYTPKTKNLDAVRKLLER